MRRMVVIIALVVATSVRATNPGDGPAPSRELRSVAVTYADELIGVLDWLGQRYIRPVPRAALAEAALAGLFETAREPMPAGLKADLANAKSEHEFQRLIASARERLGDRESLRGHRAMLASLRTLPRALDPFCGIAGPNERRDRGTTMKGVGLEFESLPDAVVAHSRGGDPFAKPDQLDGALPRGPARINVVIPGSPAQKAGLRAGDVLTHINDQVLDLSEGARHFPELFTAPGEPLRLTVQRPGQAAPLVRSVQPAEFAPELVYGVRRRSDNSWDYLLDRDNRIGYVRVSTLDDGTTEQLAGAIDALLGAGIRGLVFDLRGNPGGTLDAAEQISGMFVKPGGLVATLHKRSSDKRGPDKTEYRIPEQWSSSGILEGIATVVLIDGETRGGGEMIAAVLQDYKVARIAGQRSFGKGSVQSTFGPRNRSNETHETFNKLGIEFKLTTASFTRPSGRNLNQFPDSKPSDDWGVQPDAGLEYPVTPEFGRQIKEWMQQQILRPPDSRDPLPLDDPDNDPSREFARQLLVKKLKS